MRNMFNIQYELGCQPIEEIQIPLTSRDELPPTLLALQHIYKTPELNEQVSKIINSKIRKGKKQTGRKGMTGWEILVLATIRMSLNTDYDQLLIQANYNCLVRSIMGIENGFGEGRKTYGLQTIKDNVCLLTEEDIDKVNDLTVSLGHQLVHKKNEPLKIKSDTYVLESNVHFPTDLNLLWDSSRKIMDVMRYCRKRYKLQGWGKIKYWNSKLKDSQRSCSKACSSTSKSKEKTIKSEVTEYLKDSRAVVRKSEESMSALMLANPFDIKLIGLLYSLEYYQEMAVKHIDLVRRRLLEGEKIPQSEKVYSIFEPHTEWISKGKLNKKVELGLKVLISTDQHHFIVDYKVIQGQADCSLTIELADRLLAKFDNLYSLSIDKGFYSKENKDLLSLEIPKVILPKKGKKNQKEQEEESDKEFKQLRHAHSAVEANINQLEHNDLDRCPDKGLDGFKRYTSLGILSYNLHRVGKLLMAKSKKEEQQQLAA
jgi:transposase, IS5 family